MRGLMGRAAPYEGGSDTSRGAHRHIVANVSVLRHDTRRSARSSASERPQKHTSRGSAQAAMEPRSGGHGTPLRRPWNPAQAAMEPRSGGHGTSLRRPWDVGGHGTPLSQAAAMARRWAPQAMAQRRQQSAPHSTLFSKPLMRSAGVRAVPRRARAPACVRRPWPRGRGSGCVHAAQCTRRLPQAAPSAPRARMGDPKRRRE
jgi:hypothetical protein